MSTALGIVTLVASSPWSMSLVLLEAMRHRLHRLKYRGDLRAFLTLADLHTQFAARQHGLVAGPFQYGYVEEGIA